MKMLAATIMLIGADRCLALRDTKSDSPDDIEDVMPDLTCDKVCYMTSTAGEVVKTCSPRHSYMVNDKIMIRVNGAFKPKPFSWAEVLTSICKLCDAPEVDGRHIVGSSSKVRLQCDPKDRAEFINMKRILISAKDKLADVGALVARLAAEVGAKAAIAATRKIPKQVAAPRTGPKINADPVPAKARFVRALPIKKVMPLPVAAPLPVLPADDNDEPLDVEEEDQDPDEDDSDDIVELGRDELAIPKEGLYEDDSDGAHNVNLGGDELVIPEEVRLHAVDKAKDPIVPEDPEARKASLRQAIVKNAVGDCRHEGVKWCTDSWEMCCLIKCRARSDDLAMELGLSKGMNLIRAQDVKKCSSEGWLTEIEYKACKKVKL